MADRNSNLRVSVDKAERHAARQVVASYHQDALLGLLDHVREGFAQLDTGEIDPFELDDIIHRYKRAASKLWTFCGSSGAQWLQAANTLTYLRDGGESPPDWWEQAGPRSR